MLESLTSVSTPTDPELGGRRLERRLLDVGDDDVHAPHRRTAPPSPRPMPLAPPVTTATRPASSRIVSSGTARPCTGPPGGTPRYSACSSSSFVSFTPSASRCSRATFSSSCFGQHVDADRVARSVLVEQLDLREHLVRERARHHEARMAGRAAEVHEPALGQHDDRVAVGERPQVDLRLDRRGARHRDSGPGPAMSISLSKWPMLQTIALCFIRAMCVHGDHVHVAGGGHEDVGWLERRRRARRPGSPPSPPAAR